MKLAIAVGHNNASQGAPAAVLSPPWVLGALSALYAVVVVRNVRLIQGMCDARK